VVQQGVVFARVPGEHPPCEGSLFLISRHFPRTLFGSRGAFFSPVRSYEQAGPVLHLCQLVYSLPLHNFRDGIQKGNNEIDNKQFSFYEEVCKKVEIDGIIFATSQTEWGRGTRDRIRNVKKWFKREVMTLTQKDLFPNIERR